MLKKLNVEFYPEGGDLVAGLKNRVYFSVRTTLGKPADLKGRLLEDGKPLDVEVATLSDDKEPGVNQGMGRFEFTPKAKAKYEIQIDAPVGITSKHVLPLVKEDGVVLSVAEGVVDSDSVIKVAVHSTKERELQIGAYCRGRLLDAVHLAKGKTEAMLKANMGQGGVCRITVFEVKPKPGATRRELLPVAERLVYKQPKEQLHIAIRPDKTTYVPGQRATVTIKTVNENEESAPAVVMLAVVDKSVVTMADEKTARSMPTHFLLTTEVRRPEDLEYADFLLGTQAKAKDALDLLLGTQGWRRFAEQNPEQFRKEHNGDPAAERLLFAMGNSAQKEEIDLADAQAKKIAAENEQKLAELQMESDSARDKVNAAATAAPYLAAKLNIDQWTDRWDKFTFWGTPVLGMLLILTAFVCLGLGLMREMAKARRYYLVAAVSMAVVMVGISYWFLNLSYHEEPSRMALATDAPAPQAVQRNKMADQQAAVNNGFEGLREELAAGAGRGGMGRLPAPMAPGADAAKGLAADKANKEKADILAKFGDNFEAKRLEDRGILALQEGLGGDAKRKAFDGKMAGKGQAEAGQGLEATGQSSRDAPMGRPFRGGGGGFGPAVMKPQTSWLHAESCRR